MSPGPVSRHPLFAGIDGVMAAGQLTLRDLATWLDRPYMTVKEWIGHGRWPSACFHEDIEKRLTLLRECIRKAHERGELFIPSHRSRSSASRADQVKALYRIASRKPKKARKKKWTRKPKTTPSRKSSTPSSP